MLNLKTFLILKNKTFSDVQMSCIAATAWKIFLLGGEGEREKKRYFILQVLNV